MWGREIQLMTWDDVTIHAMSSFHRGGYAGLRWRPELTRLQEGGLSGNIIPSGMQAEETGSRQKEPCLCLPLLPSNVTSCDHLSLVTPLLDCATGILTGNLSLLQFHLSLHGQVAKIAFGSVIPIPQIFRELCYQPCEDQSPEPGPRLISPG